MFNWIKKLLTKERIPEPQLPPTQEYELVLTKERRLSARKRMGEIEVKEANKTEAARMVVFMVLASEAFKNPLSAKKPDIYH